MHERRRVERSAVVARVDVVKHAAPRRFPAHDSRGDLRDLEAACQSITHAHRIRTMTRG
jgi:hypothetical protein